MQVEVQLQLQVQFRREPGPSLLRDEWTDFIVANHLCAVYSLDNPSSTSQRPSARIEETCAHR